MAPAATSNVAPAAAPAASKGSGRIQADPELVQYPTFNSQPSTSEEFYQRAEHVSELLFSDLAVRDRGNVVPNRQVCANFAL